jgi:hypothetical protein
MDGYRKIRAQLSLSAASTRRCREGELNPHDQ